MHVTIYGSKTCTWCEQAKQLCNRTFVSYDYIDLTAEGNEQLLHEFKGKGYTTVPQIFEGERHIGGFQELHKELGSV